MRETPQEYREWQKESYKSRGSITERACFGVVRDRWGNIRPNAKELIGILMAAIGTYGPAGCGLSIEKACAIGLKEAKAVSAYEEILLRSQGLLT